MPTADRTPAVAGNCLLYNSMTALTNLTIGKGPRKASLASMLEKDGLGGSARICGSEN